MESNFECVAHPPNFMFKALIEYPLIFGYDEMDTRKFDINEFNIYGISFECVAHPPNFMFKGLICNLIAN